MLHRGIRPHTVTGTDCCYTRAYECRTYPGTRACSIRAAVNTTADVLINALKKYRWLFLLSVTAYVSVIYVCMCLDANVSDRICLPERIACLRMSVYLSVRLLPPVQRGVRHDHILDDCSAAIERGAATTIGHRPHLQQGPSQVIFNGHRLHVTMATHSHAAAAGARRQVGRSRTG